MPVGGSIESVTLAGRIFPVAADADVTRKLGGFENEVLANGDGSARLQKTRVPANLSGLVLSVDDARGDQEYIQELADGKDFFPASITLASGEIWQGALQIQGEFTYSTQTATATLNLSGAGKITKQ
jgi:hypothetical protein